MAKFSIKSEYFTTPIKLILPGIIVATAGYFLFNNPDKKKAKETYYNWNVIKEYEAAFQKGTEDAICLRDTLDQIRFRKDYTHLLNILINNLSDLKKDNNVDKRLDAFLNIKIARYSEAKLLTDVYLDTVMILNQETIFNPDNTRIKEIADQKQQIYINELAHIETRDTAELRRIANQLNKQHKSYTDSFLVNNDVLQPIDELKKYFMGKWWFPELLVMIDLKKDHSGIWEFDNEKVDFKWTFDNYVITLKFEGEENHFFIPKASPSTISIFWKERNAVTIGCRRAMPK